MNGENFLLVLEDPFSSKTCFSPLLSVGFRMWEFSRFLFWAPLCICWWTSVAVQSLSRVWLSATPRDCSTPGLPVPNHLPEFAHTHVHRVGDAIQPSHPLPSPSPPAFNRAQHQGLFQWVSSLHHVAKVLELQLQHVYFQWIFRVDFR